MAREMVTRAILEDWMCNDGLNHLFGEGYLRYELVDPDDPELRSAVATAHSYWKSYEEACQLVQDLVDGFLR